MKKRFIICIAFMTILSILFIQRNEIISFAESTLFLDTTFNSQGKIVHAGTVLFDCADLGTLKDSINNLATVVDDQTVPKYSSNANYSVGNQVIYNDVIYTCIKAGTDKTPSENAEYWTNISALNDSLTALTPKLLWENPTPNNAFLSQNITLNSSDYDFLEIYYKREIGNSVFLYTKAQKGCTFSTDYYGVSSGSYQFVDNRFYTYIDDTTYQIGDNKEQRSNSSSSSVENSMNIPVKIYGIKYA